VLKEILQDTAVGRTYTETDHNPWFLLLISFALYPDPYSQANYRIPPLWKWRHQVPPWRW